MHDSSFGVLQVVPVANSTTSGRKTASTASFAVIFWLVILGAVGVGQRYLNRVLKGLPNRPVSLEHPLYTLPKSIGTWRGTDIMVDSRVMELTGADDYVARRYVDETNRDAVDAYVVYTSRPATMIDHHAGIAFPASGWQSQGEKSIQLERSNGAAVDCNVFYFSREDKKWQGRVVLDYFVLGGRHTADADEFRNPKWRQPNFARDPSYYVAQVQIVAAASNAADYERAASAVQRFAMASADDVDSLLPLARDSESSVANIEKGP